MNLLQYVQEKAARKVPLVRTGYTVKVHQKIREGEKTRTQIFEGLVIKINSGHGSDRSFTVRKVVEGIGVERVYPLYSPNIEKIEVIKKSKVRRAKLFYMRDRSGKSARLKERFVSAKELSEEIDPLGQMVAERDAAANAAAEKEAAKVAAEAEKEATANAVEEAPVEEAPVEEAAAPEEAPASEEAEKSE
jgi:large subunit ribosomal protein L19